MRSWCYDLLNYDRIVGTSYDRNHDIGGDGPLRYTHRGNSLPPAPLIFLVLLPSLVTMRGEASTTHFHYNVIPFIFGSKQWSQSTMGSNLWNHEPKQTTSPWSWLSQGFVVSLISLILPVRIVSAWSLVITLNFPPPNLHKPCSHFLIRHLSCFQQAQVNF